MGLAAYGRKCGRRVQVFGHGASITHQRHGAGKNKLVELVHGSTILCTYLFIVLTEHLGGNDAAVLDQFRVLLRKKVGLDGKEGHQYGGHEPRSDGMHAERARDSPP